MKNVFRLFVLILLGQSSLAQSRFLYDQSGNRVQRIATPDLTPSITLPQSIFLASGSESVRNFTVTLQEVAGQQTSSGTIQFVVTAPSGYSLSYDNTITSMTPTGNPTSVSVDNTKWTVVSNIINLQLILKINANQFIAANMFSTIGFTITRNAVSSGSYSNLNVSISDDPTFTYDSNNTNNIFSRIITAY